MVRLATRAHGWAALSRHRDQLAANVAHEQEIPDVARVGHRLGHVVVVGNVEDVRLPDPNAEPVVEVAGDAAELVAVLAAPRHHLAAALEQPDRLDAAKRNAASIIAKNRPERMRDPKSAGGDHRLCTVNSTVRVPTRCLLSATRSVTL